MFMSNATRAPSRTACFDPASIRPQWGSHCKSRTHRTEKTVKKSEKKKNRKQLND
jgi:hypothetical protein